MKIYIRLITSLCFASAINASQVVRVNGEPIDKAELELEISDQRTAVYSYFAEKFSLGEKALIWTKSYRGEIPLKRLHEKAMEKAIERKLLQIQMKKYGLLNDISYKGFQFRYQKIQNQRKRDLAEGRVVYGLPLYSIRNYFFYDFENQLNALKSILYQRQIIRPRDYGNWQKGLIRNAKVKIYAGLSP